MEMMSIVNKSMENRHMEEEEEEEGSLVEEYNSNNQTKENGEIVPWQMFRHVIEQVRFFWS